MMEETLARTVAEARQLEAVMAVLGAVLVGSDAYSRALELAPLVLAGDRQFSKMVAMLKWGYRRMMALRTLQATARSRLQRPLGPNSEFQTGALVVRPGSPEMWAQSVARDR